MYGTSESPAGLTVCGSCIMAPLPPLDEDDIDNAQLDHNHDLSYLSQEGQRNQARKSLKGQKSVNQVQMDMVEMFLKSPTPLQEVEPVKKLKLKSNSVRDRMHPVGSLMLKFDEDGVAEFAEHHLAAVKAYMALRPGRFRVLEDEKKKPKKDPRKALEAARAALEVAKAAEKEPEPEEPKAEEPAPVEVKPEAPKAEAKAEEPKPKPKARKTTKKSSRKKSEES